MLLRAVTCFSHSYGEAPFLCAYTFSRASLAGSDSTVNGVEYFDLVGGPADDTSAGHGGDSSASAPTTDTACAW